MPYAPGVLTSEARVAADEFVAAWGASSIRGRRRLRAAMPLDELGAAAVHQPDPFPRRRLPAILDHHDNEGSACEREPARSR